MDDKDEGMNPDAGLAAPPPPAEEALVAENGGTHDHVVDSVAAMKANNANQSMSEDSADVTAPAGGENTNAVHEQNGNWSPRSSQDTASEDSQGRVNFVVERKERRFRDLFVKLIAPLLVCIFGWACAAAFLGGMIYQVTLDRSGFYFARQQNLDDWSYLGATNPPSWPNVSSFYATCSQGLRQSPINLVQVGPSVVLDPLDRDEFPFLGSVLELENLSRVSVVWRDHSPFYQCLDNPCGTVQWNNSLSERFEIQEFVFRTLAEHSLRGFSTGLELQLIANNSIGDYNGSFVSSLLSSGFQASSGEEEESPVSQTLSALFSILNTSNTVEVDLTTLVPQPLNATGYFAYDGSMTYPPCFEGYRWMVANVSVPGLDNALIREYAAFLGYPGNYRNQMSLNNRPIYRYIQGSPALPAFVSRGKQT